MRDRRELLGVERDIERRPFLEDVTRDRRLPFAREVGTQSTPWWDSAWFGALMAAACLGFVVAICLIMGWVRP